MHILLSLLDANLALHQHAAKALEKALERRQKDTKKQPTFDEQAFTQAQLALREAEVRELSLLHQTAVLAQSLRREGTGRQAEKKLAQTEEIVDILLAQHEALAVAAALFKALDPRLILLDSDADAAVRKTYTLAGDCAPRLRELVIEEVKQGRPGRLAAALEAHRRKQRQHMTRLSNARRHFAAFFYQHIPLIGAL